jgi:hypothetical protein
VLAVVERVQRVMVGPGVLGIFREDRQGDAAGLQRHGRIAFALGNGREQRQRVERGSLVVVGKLRVQGAHAIGVGLQARGLITAAEQLLDGVEVALLAHGCRLRLARRYSRPQPRQHRAALVE